MTDPDAVDGDDAPRSATIEDSPEVIWELGDAVSALRSDEGAWSGLERESLLVAIEGSLAAHRAGAVSDVTLDAQALLGVLRGGTSMTVDSEVAGGGQGPHAGRDGRSGKGRPCRRVFVWNMRDGQRGHGSGRRDGSAGDRAGVRGRSNADAK